MEGSQETRTPVGVGGGLVEGDGRGVGGEGGDGEWCSGGGVVGDGETREVREGRWNGEGRVPLIALGIALRWVSWMTEVGWQRRR